MKREDITLIAKFLMHKKSNATTFPFYEFEQELGIKKEILIRSLSILKKLAGTDYEIIPWNPSEEEQNDWTSFRKAAGIIKPKTKEQTEHHINEEGVLFKKINRKILSNIIKSPDKITDASLEEEKYYELPTFDEKRSVIMFGDKECPIPPGRNLFYFCKEIFSHPVGEFVEDREIRTAIDMIKGINKKESGERSVYDAMLGVNKIVEKCFDIAQMMEFEGGRIRIKREIFK